MVVRMIQMQELLRGANTSDILSLAQVCASIHLILATCGFSQSSAQSMTHFLEFIVPHDGW
jgi:hypothetical protein